MKKVSKTEVKQVVETAMTQVFEQLGIPKASRKTKKSVSRISKQIRNDWKRQSKKALKSMGRNGKANAHAVAAA